MDFTIGTSTGFCWKTAAIWQFVGWIVMILKVVIPVILIVLGIIAFGKAIIADDDKEISSAVTALIRKFIAAVVIFFIPAIISAAYFAISTNHDVEDDSNVCIKCVTSPNTGCVGEGIS